MTDGVDIKVLYLMHNQKMVEAQMSPSCVKSMYRSVYIQPDALHYMLLGKSSHVVLRFLCRSQEDSSLSPAKLVQKHRPIELLEQIRTVAHGLVGLLALGSTTSRSVCNRH